MSKTIHYALCGLEYVYIVNAPIGVDDGDNFIYIPPEGVDRMIAIEIVQKGVPLRGREVVFLRKALKMSRNQWADKLGVSASVLLRWEQKLDKRLSRVNEVAIRLLSAEQLEVELPGKWSAVVIVDDHPMRLEIAV
jgi:DNA-binding transcriptional regulator YiaG